MLGDGAREEARDEATIALARESAVSCGVRLFERSVPSLGDLSRTMTLLSLSNSLVVPRDFCWRDGERVLAEKDRSAWLDDLVARVVPNS